MRMKLKPHVEMRVGKKEKGHRTKEAEVCLSKLLPPCYISALMIAAMPNRQAATLTLMVSLI